MTGVSCGLQRRTARSAHVRSLPAGSTVMCVLGDVSGPQEIRQGCLFFAPIWPKFRAVVPTLCWPILIPESSVMRRPRWLREQSCSSLFSRATPSWLTPAYFGADTRSSPMEFGRDRLNLGRFRARKAGDANSIAFNSASICPASSELGGFSSPSACARPRGHPIGDTGRGAGNGSVGSM